jgi:hypothetical protein
VEDVLNWLNKQECGINTYHEFRTHVKAYKLNNPDEAAALRLLTTLVDEFIWRYAEDPLPHDIGIAAFEKLKDAVARTSRAKGTSAEHQLSVLNEIARIRLTDA